MVHRMTGLDPLILFRSFPPFFYALTPAFVYLISRKCFDVRDSITATLAVAFSSYIFFFPDIGRVGVALGLLSGLIWALLHKKLLTSMSFAILIVYTHYGTTIIAIGLVGAILVARLLWDRSLIKVTVVTLCTLVLFTGAWHFGISHYSGDSMTRAMLHPTETVGYVPEGDFLELESRDYVTQAAFGENFANNPIPLKFEIIINWVVVCFITLGLYLVIRNRNVDKVFKSILITLYGLTIASIVFPPISVFYGTQRVYFTSCLVLASCFPVGTKWLSNKIHLSPIWLTSLVLILYGATTSGLTYKVFGLTKSIPIVLTLTLP